MTDPADNPLSGGAADTPTLFRELLAVRRGLFGSIADGDVAFGFFADPVIVATARAAGIGARIDASLGSRHGLEFGAPVPVTATVLRFTDGRFINVGPMERGALVDTGPSVVLDVDGIRVIVTSAVAAANDPAFFQLHGLDPLRLRLLCVKAKNHFHAAFAPIAAAIIDVDCPGPAASNLDLLAFRTRLRVRR